MRVCMCCAGASDISGMNANGVCVRKQEIYPLGGEHHLNICASVWYVTQIYNVIWMALLYAKRIQRTHHISLMMRLAHSIRIRFFFSTVAATFLFLSLLCGCCCCCHCTKKNLVFRCKFMLNVIKSKWKIFVQNLHSMILAMATGRGCALVSGWAIPNATTQSVCDVCYSGALHHNLDVTFNIPLFPFFFWLVFA